MKVNDLIKSSSLLALTLRGNKSNFSSDFCKAGIGVPFVLDGHVSSLEREVGLWTTSRVVPHHRVVCSVGIVVYLIPIVGLTAILPTGHVDRGENVVSWGM